jgi:hypothetical protein
MEKENKAKGMFIVYVVFSILSFFLLTLIAYACFLDTQDLTTLEGVASVTVSIQQTNQ